MKHNKVSVIIPVYNMEEYLADTLESVLSSDYPNFEVIVMDDGSTDESLAIAKSYAENDSRIRVYSKPNEGASSARNRAIYMAHGRYILPIDGDDLIANNYISMAVAVLDKNPNVKVVSREAQFIGDKKGRWNFELFSLNLLCRRNLIDVSSMFRKSDWKIAGGYCKEILGREDWDFWLSLFETGGDFFRLPIVGLYYRIRPNSKRVQTRHLHKNIVDALNARHKPLFYKELCGKLHYQRTHSKAINKLIRLFRPYKVCSKTSDPILEKLVYAANESNATKDFLNLNENLVRYISFQEKRFHIPGTRIKKSKAQQAFDASNKLHLGYYEEQVSFLIMKSYLVLFESNKHNSIKLSEVKTTN